MYKTFQRSASKQNFYAWMDAVNAIIEAKTGCSALDLPDYCYRDAYDEGRSAKSTAREAIRNANE